MKQSLRADFLNLSGIFMPAYKNEKRGTWFCKFYYEDWNGIKKQKKKEGFKTKKEAQEWERNFLNQCRVDSDITFENLCSKYMEYCSARLKPTTMSSKQWIVKAQILPYFKSMKLKDIKASTCREWQDRIIASQNNYTQSYLKEINTQLSAIFNFAVKNDYISYNPLRKCGSMGKKYSAGDIQFWTLEEFEAFNKAMSDEPIYQMIFALLFYSGIREGEMFALTLNDFDFNNNTISITKTYVKLKCKDIIQPPKTPKSNRVITMPEPVMKTIKEYADTIYEYNPNDRIFTCSRYRLSRAMIRGCEKSGVKEIRLHDLRHSHASLLIELGFPPLLISERLGHENVNTTLQIYSHLYPNKQKEVSDRLTELM